MRRALRPCALAALVGLLATPALQAAVESRATASGWAQVGQQPRQASADPADQPFRIAPGFSVMAKVTNFDGGLDHQGNGLGSTANATIGLLGGTPFADLLTSGYEGTTNEILAGTFLRLDGTVLGDPGRVGRIDLSGSFWASVQYLGERRVAWAEADLSYHLALVLSGPGQAACPNQRCERRIDFRTSLDGGDGLLDDLLGGGYDLSLEAQAGDRIEIFVGLGARLSNGYWVVVRDPDMPALDGATGLAAPGPSKVLESLRLSNGLGLSADIGLMQRPDGSWGLPVSPVPEPASALLMSLGLGLAAWARRRAREA